MAGEKKAIRAALRATILDELGEDWTDLGDLDLPEDKDQLPAFAIATPRSSREGESADSETISHTVTVTLWRQQTEGVFDALEDNADQIERPVRAALDDITSDVRLTLEEEVSADKGSVPAGALRLHFTAVIIEDIAI